MARLAERYKNEVVPALIKEFQYKSPMEVPRVLKVVLNSGVGEASANPKAMQFADYAMRQISGQKPMITRARKSIASFKLRQGAAVGCMVTLRNRRMYEFLDRFISVALPRLRDFRGIPKKGFDGNGNYTMGLKEQIVFPEIDIDKLDKIRGMDISIITSAKSDEEARELLRLLGLPFRK
jgi:large subunit ribosomal protein L5